MLGKVRTSAFVLFGVLRFEIWASLLPEKATAKGLTAESQTGEFQRKATLAFVFDV